MFLKLSNILCNDSYEFPSLLSKPNNVRKPSIPEREVRHWLDYHLPINCMNSWRKPITFTISCRSAPNFILLAVRLAFFITQFSWETSVWQFLLYLYACTRFFYNLPYHLPLTSSKTKIEKESYLSTIICKYLRSEYRLLFTKFIIVTSFLKAFQTKPGPSKHIHRILNTNIKSAIIIFKARHPPLNLDPKKATGKELSKVERMILYKFMEHHSVDFLWTTKRDRYDWLLSNKEVVISR